MTWRHLRNSALIAVNGALATACAGIMAWDLLDAAGTGRPCAWLTARLVLFVAAAAGWSAWAFKEARG